MPAYSSVAPSASGFLPLFLACMLISPAAPTATPQVSGHEGIKPTLIAKGNYLLSIKQYQQALRIFKEAAEKERPNPYAFRGLAQAWKGDGQLAKGEAFLKDYLATRPRSDSAMYGLGYLYYLDERWSESEEYLNKAIESNPENALALNNLGAVYAHNNKVLQAVDLIKKAIDLNPSESLFYSNLYGVYAQSASADRFESEFHELLKARSVEKYTSESQEVRAVEIARGYGITLARHKRQEGFRLYSQGKLKETIDKFLELLEIFKSIKRPSGIVAALFSLGVLYEEQGNLTRAIENFRKVLKINPNHLQAQERIKALKKD